MTVCRLGCPPCSSFIAHLQPRLIHTSGLTLAAASSGLTTVVPFSKVLLFHLASASLLSPKKSKNIFSRPSFHFDKTDQQLQRDKKRKKPRRQFPSQPPLTEKQRATHEAFLNRQDISISPLTVFFLSFFARVGLNPAARRE